MTIKTTRFLNAKVDRRKKILIGFRSEVYFQMGDVQYFNTYHLADGFIEVAFYNGNRILIEHNVTDFAIKYEESRPKGDMGFLGLN